MNQLHLFLPCAAGVEGFLADEVHAITGASGEDLLVGRGGVMLRGAWRDVLLLNLHSRLAQRVLVELALDEYRNENDIYRAASQVAWEIWFTPRQSFKVEVTAQHSPLQSLNFAALRVKDAVADRFRGENETIDPVGGHIPGALNHFFKENVDASGRFKSPGELRAAFQSLLGDTPAEQIIHQCGSGVTACHNLLAMEIAGLPGASLYPGSWSEWCRQRDVPIATGRADSE